MAHKNCYKKIFVGVAALFVLFVPVGSVLKTNLALAQQTIQTQTPTINTTIPTQSIQTLSVTPTTVPAAGTTAASTANTTPATVTGNSALVTAQNSSPNLLTHPITGAVYFVAYAVDSVMSLAVMGTAALVRLGLQFNDNIYNSPAVQTGFSVSLAIANLGFVLGIIIIALATILRNQTYGIKQLLWKLVVMAILVNFGLVITAPIVGFAGSMTNYFINATSPSGATGGYEGYVGTMAQAFAPQAVGSGVQGSGCAGATGGLAGICNTSQQSGTAPDSFMKSLLALVFGIAFLALTAFTFLCLAILLIIRYLMLGGLLIVLPLAWLTWVFPKFDNSYSKWWNTFIKWTFFPPLALFFIYLAFITATNTTTPNTYLQQTAGIPSSAQTGVEGALAGQTGLGGPIQQAADEVLLVGLCIMGLMFANSLTGKAGSMVVNGATSASKAAAGYVGKKTGKGAARLYQKAGGNDLNAALQRSRIYGVSAIGRGAANLTESATKNQVDARHKALGLGGMDDDRLQAVTQGLHGKEDQLAAVQEWQKRGKVDKIEKIGGDNFSDWLSKNQGTFKDYGRGKLSGDIDNAMMSNDKTRRIAKVTAAARATVDTQAATDSAQVVDKSGIMGLAGATVSAKDLAKAAQKETTLEEAQATIDNPKSSKTAINDAKAHIKQFQDAADDADKAIASAIEKKVDEVDVIDKENLLGRGAGTSAKAGEFKELMHTESEKFWEGKDKGAIGKGNASAIFGDKSKFGLNKETLTEIGRSVAHAIATQTPASMGSIAGKLDNSKQLETFTALYKTSIEDARKSSQMTDRRARELNSALKKVLAGKLAYMGAGASEAAPASMPVPPLIK